MRSDSSFDKIVHVRHGPIVYSDDPEHVIETVPSHLRSVAVPFLKSTSYAHQREYRATISTLGTPLENELLIPVTNNLRALSGAEAHI